MWIAPRDSSLDMFHDMFVHPYRLTGTGTAHQGSGNETSNDIFHDMSIYRYISRYACVSILVLTRYLTGTGDRCIDGKY